VHTKKEDIVLLLMQLAMFVLGVYALIAGKLKLSKKLRMEGKQARITGLILMAPLSVALLLGLAKVVLLVSGIIDESAMRSLGSSDLVLVVGGVGAAFVYASSRSSSGPPPPTGQGMDAPTGGEGSG
jgi:hypothetical protein